MKKPPYPKRKGDNKMEILKLVNGNKQEYEQTLPTLVILEDCINDVALAHIKENTGLVFKKSNWDGYTAIPFESSQIVRLLLTYNYKTQYHNNANSKNTLYLKSDHHIGFKVDSICFDCVKHNHITAHGLEATDRLSC